MCVHTHCIDGGSIRRVCRLKLPIPHTSHGIQCHLKLNELPQALRALTAIPARQRVSIPTIQAALGGLYRKMVLPQEAAEAYRACVEHHPLVLEAVVALAELGTATATATLISQPRRSTVAANPTVLTYDPKMKIPQGWARTNSGRC